MTDIMWYKKQNQTENLKIDSELLISGYLNDCRLYLFPIELKLLIQQFYTQNNSFYAWTIYKYIKLAQ